MAPTRANTMPSAIGHILRPSVKVVDIRDDHSTKVFNGVQDPYEVGGPRAGSEFVSNSPLPPPALTPPPGFHNGSLLARSISGDTVVPFPLNPEAQILQDRSYIKLIEHLFPAPPMPDLASAQAARKELMGALHKYSHLVDGNEQAIVDRARKNFYDTIDGINKPYVAWREHLIDLVVASHAYRAMRDEELATNFEGLNDDWTSGALTAIREPTEVGLSQHIRTLTDMLAIMDDAALPALLALEENRWGSRHRKARQLASNIRLDVVKTTGQIIEALSPKLIDERTTQLAQLAHHQAKSLLASGNHLYNRGAVTLALHRMLHALRGTENTAASTTVAEAYNALIGTDNSDQNRSLIISYGDLVAYDSKSMILSTQEKLEESVEKLGKIAEGGETPDIRGLAQLTQLIIILKLKNPDTDGDRLMNIVESEFTHI